MPAAKKIYDIIGIGIGPFNLGLAALCQGIPELSCLFIDQKESFDWHPGLLLDSARLQVPFYADLVTLANPCSKFSYLSFLKANNRLFRFAIHEHYFPTRKEYNEYCRWVISQLPNLQFGKTCVDISFDGINKKYEIQLVDSNTGDISLLHAKHIIIGTGTVPYVPLCAKSINHPLVFHSGEYLLKKDSLLTVKSISIVGSGQSAAEIFNDLMPYQDRLENLYWFTRSSRFFPMEYSKLTLEMTSPDYIDYFFKLSPEKKKTTLQCQDALYKGINFSLVNEIYDQLYLKSLDSNSSCETGLFTHCDLKQMRILENNKLQLDFLHTGYDNCFEHSTDVVILATGYRHVVPLFLQPLKEHIRWTENGQYNVNLNYSIDNEGKTLFVQNADLYTHGFNSADLGMGPYRNAIILNTILGYEHFILEKNITFQTFGPPRHFNYQ